jgi:hypothetical protein
MIAPTLMAITFSAGASSTITTIPPFDDTKSSPYTGLCGPRICSNDSSFVTWIFNELTDQRSSRSCIERLVPIVPRQSYGLFTPLRVLPPLVLRLIAVLLVLFMSDFVIILVSRPLTPTHRPCSCRKSNYGDAVSHVVDGISNIIRVNLALSIIN